MIAAFEGISFPTPSTTVQMALGNGHQGISDTAIGTYKFDKAAGKPEMVDIVRYPAAMRESAGGRQFSRLARRRHERREVRLKTCLFPKGGSASEACGWGSPFVLTTFAILTDGLVYAAYLFLVAVGLTLIFGVMQILNVTHGSFYAFGAYGSAIAVGIYFDRGLPAAGGFLLMVLVAMAIGLVLGLVLERGLLRLVYGKDEVIVVLVTYAAFLILEDAIQLIWGPNSYALYQPLDVAGTVDVGPLVLSGYDIGLVVFAGLLAVGGELRAQAHPMGPSAHGRDLRSRDRRSVRHQCDRSCTPSPSSSAPCSARSAAR